MHCEMAARPVLPLSDVCATFEEDVALLRQDGLDVWTELYNLSVKDYDAWKQECWDAATRECGWNETLLDEHGWRRQHVQCVCDDLISRGKMQKQRELQKKTRACFDWWWSEEYAKISRGERIRRRGEKLQVSACMDSNIGSGPLHSLYRFIAKRL